MSTRRQIVQLADTLIREQGYNAFSFYDISKSIGIKTASIHYHFPAKADLGLAVIDYHTERLNKVIDSYSDKSPLECLDKFLSIYTSIRNENKVCLVGSLATDFNTLDEQVQARLRAFSETMLNWVSQFLEEGKKSKVFAFEGLPRTKAIMIITNMLAIVQLSRLTGAQDFELVKERIKQDLIKS